MRLPIATLMVLLAAGPARAQAADDEVRSTFKSGSALYEQKDYKGALVYFVKAFEMSGKPEILFNIALCHRNLGEYDKAIAYYARYLELRPDASDRAEVEKKIDNLRFLQTQKAPPPAAEQPPPPPAQLQPPPAAPPPAAQAAPAVTQTAPPPEEEPIYGKWWFWTAVGVVVTGAIVGIAVGTSGGSESLPATTDGSLGRLP